MDMTEKQLPIGGRRKWIKPTIYAGLIVILCMLPLFIKSPYLIHIFIMTLIYIIAAVSLRFIIISGQFPLAHAAFMGIGAYTSAITSKDLGVTPWLTMPLGALVAMAIGMLIGYPFARLRALYYAMVSLFFGIGITEVIAALTKWTGGTTGLTGMPPLLHVASKVPYFYFFLGFTSICLLVMYRLESCRIGTTLKAIDQSYLVASSIGINEARYRVLALAVGCFFAGLAGAAYAHYNLTLASHTFNITATLWLVMYVIIGGIGSFAGPIIGTAILIIVPELLRGLKEFVPFVFAGILLIVVYLMPQGIVGLPEMIKSRFIERRNVKKVTYAP
jgi:branched-chain amino acid transport system permease protein